VSVSAVCNAPVDTVHISEVSVYVMSRTVDTHCQHFDIACFFDDCIELRCLM